MNAIRRILPAMMVWYQVAVVVAAELPPGRLPMHPPVREASMHSERSDNPTAILFVNRTGADLLLFWLDFEGQRQPYGTLGTAEPFRRTTYATHVWLVANATGKALGLFVGDEKEGLAEIGVGTNVTVTVAAESKPPA